MSDLNKYHGIFPAFYACYNDYGSISPKRIQKLVSHYIESGVKGLYVGGSSGECIYQTLEERKLVLESVMSVAKDKLTIIAHIGAPNTRDSVSLALHAKEQKVDALSSIPPIYFPLSDSSVQSYWSEMATATDLDFFIYNIPQLTNYNLSTAVYQNLLQLPQVIGVKNSSAPVIDIMRRKMEATKDVIVFNGPDEQYIAGRIMGADGGIGGTYGVMPSLFLQLEKLYINKDLPKAQILQQKINKIIFELTGCKGHLYSVAKQILKFKGIDVGTGRPPLKSVEDDEMDRVKNISNMIDKTIDEFCK